MQQKKIEMPLSYVLTSELIFFYVVGNNLNDPDYTIFTIYSCHSVNNILFKKNNNFKHFFICIYRKYPFICF